MRMVPGCGGSVTQTGIFREGVAPAGSADREAVGGAQDAGGAAVQHVGVDHGGGHVAVAEELLDGADVGAVLQEVGGEGVAEGVAGGSLRDARAAYGVTDCALHGGLVEVMAA